MERKPFFRPVDWYAFWAATLVSFGVYFYTLGPSVGLEDSGELAVAGDHLGVPHPPGYPIWTMIAWCFCRVFGWVTFRGHPSPAWCISLASAVAGALAAGITAMLIARSGSDMLRDVRADDSLPDPDADAARNRREGWMCWAGGVGASLAFAFSPVMWSQSVIVEVYALGALFLMWVLLLTYRWMRQPLDRTLWLLAFVFGLGLTNYQVLLLALIPLVLIVLFKNARLFRDFALAGIPILLTAYILSLGALSSADHYSTPNDPVISRHWHQTTAAGADAHGLLMFTAATKQPAFAARGRAIDDSLRQAEAATDPKRIAELLNTAKGQLESLRTSAADYFPGAKARCDAFLKSTDKTLADAEKIAADPTRSAAARRTAATNAAKLREKRNDESDCVAAVSATLAVVDGCAERLKSIDPKADSSAISELRKNRKNLLTVSSPPPVPLWGGVILLITGALGFFLRPGRNVFLFFGIAALGALTLLLLPEGAARTTPFISDIPLISSRWYMSIGAVVGFLIAMAFAFAWFFKDESALPDWRSPTLRTFLAAAAVALTVLAALLISLPSPETTPPNFRGTLLSFNIPWALTIAALTAMVVMSWGSSKSMIFATTVSVVQITLMVMLQKGILLGLEHPTTWWFWWPFIWNFALLLLAWRCLENGRSVAPTIFFAQLGVSFYAYMPIVSDLLNPPMNWGYPRTWEGFKHAISRGQYEQIKPTDIFTGTFMKQLGAYFSDVRMQFTLLAAPLALLPFANWSLRKGKVRIFNFAAVLFVICGLFVFAAEVMGEEPVGRVDKYLLAAMGIFALLGFIYMLLDECDYLLRRAWEERSMITGWVTGCAVIGGLVAVMAVIARIILAILAGDAEPSLLDLILAGAFGIILGMVPPFFWVFGGRKQCEEGIGLRNGFDTVGRQWLIGTVLAFLVMSVMLIALANPRGDVQDGFIQKVKFISSHGIFALWMGYGLIFGLDAADHFVKWLRLPQRMIAFTRAAAICLALATALIPIWENYMNDNLVFLMGAAEQNGHDFGWQFGYYQLEGAKGITPELEPEEEPLPNPFYPEAMPKDSFFFGGTDPGRFVPTYMIYSADVRPDVFLVTQNALADKTFMSVTRDLYGDRIWIPSEWDSAAIFSRVSDEIASGKRGGAEVKVINGRRQVSGAQGVMEINADLARAIFENNKKKHAFFIEESYAIQWMYPYLTPHGLIMKINAEPTAISPENIRDDLDFWDWYTRRLTDRPDYRRDFVAQKSFCKLRTALGGLYHHHGSFKREAKRAYIEALWLYPEGPEAVFRYLQDVLLPAEDFNPENKDLLSIPLFSLENYLSRDPNSRSGQITYERLRDWRIDYQRIGAITEKIKAGSVTTAQVAEIAELYFKVGDAQASKSYWKQVLAAPDLSEEACISGAAILARVNDSSSAMVLFNRISPALYPTFNQDQLFTLASLCGKVGRSETSVDLLKLYIRNNPRNWQAHMNLGIAYWQLSRENEAAQAVETALDLDPQAAGDFISNAPALKPLLQRIIDRSRQDAPTALR